MYQCFLTYGGLEEYIQHAPRVDIISMNKEGIFSFAGNAIRRLLEGDRDPSDTRLIVLERFLNLFRPFSILGYLAIFLVGVDVGLYVLPNDPYFFMRRKSNKKKAKKGKLAMILVSLCFLLCLGFTTSYGILQIPVSRQMVRKDYYGGGGKHQATTMYTMRLYVVQCHLTVFHIYI